MPTPVDMQHHPRQRASRPLFTVPPAFARPGHQARRLQRRLDPAVAELHGMLLGQLLGKVLHIEIKVLLPVQSQHLLHRGHRDSFGTGPLPPPVKQAVIAVFLVAPFPALQTARGNPQNLGRLHPQNLPTGCPQNHFLYLHGPLQCSGRIK